MKTIKLFLIKHRFRLTILSAVVTGIIALINFYYILVLNPVSNDECIWEPSKGYNHTVILTFRNVKVDGVTWNAGIRDGDILLEIDDVKVRNANEAQITLNKRVTGDFAKYVFERNGKKLEGLVYIKKLISFGNLGIALLGFIWLVVGFIVVMGKIDGKVQRVFYRIGVAFVLFMSILLISDAFDSNPMMKYLGFVLTFDVIWSAGAFALPFMLVYFFLLFPKPFRIIEKKWLVKALVISSIVLFLLTYLYRWFVVYIPGNPTMYQLVVRIANAGIGVGLLVGFILLFINYRRIKTKEERKPYFIILIAYTLGLLSVVYVNTLANVIADTIFNSPEYYMPIILVALIPVSFAYSIFKYQLMDISVVVKNTIIYGVATASIAIIYLLFSYVLGQSIGLAIGTQYRSAIAAIAFVIFAFVFQSTKEKFQRWLTRKFYPEQFTYQEVVLKFSNEVVTIVGKDNILDNMTETFVSSLKIKRFGILLQENNSAVYLLKREFGITTTNMRINDDNKLLHNYVMDRIKINQQPFIDQQKFAEIFPAESELLLAEEIFTVVPMIIKSKIIGLLLFGVKYSGSEFAGKDIELLCAAANQSGVALENARLYESEVKKLTIERDLENARKIQESLLPKELPKLEGLEICGKMIPAMQVGGDYFDLIQVSPTKLFVIVGDVSGKGLSASIYMSKLQTMVQLYCVEGSSPKDILVQINKKIYENIERNWFITVSLALIDTATKSIKFCRAGHAPLLIVNNSINILQSKGIGLGLEEGKIFEESLEEIEIPFKHNEVFVFFSDGISEAMNEKNDLYGIEGLAEVIKNNNSKPVKEIMSEVMRSIETFRGNYEQNDDITIVLVKPV
ncbi:MAG: hypothetical protein C4539_04370 [Ignavibacteriales bacterium]|nr:MAG: hypothetical protein C4539_04370 [Ignavibacteriales bacterium]